MRRSSSSGGREHESINYTEEKVYVRSECHEQGQTKSAPESKGHFKISCLT